MGAFFFILTLVALIGVLVNRKKIPNYGVVAGGLAGLALVLSLFRLTSGSQVHPDLRAPPVYELSVGHALGKAAVKAFPGGGDLLVIRLRFDKSWARAKAPPAQSKRVTIMQSLAKDPTAKPPRVAPCGCAARRTRLPID